MIEPPPDPDASVAPTDDAVLAGAIAHEVNSPLSVVLASIDLTMEALARLEALAAVHLTAETPAWLDAELREARSCLADARSSATEIERGLARRVGPAAEAASSSVAGPLRADVGPAAERIRILVLDDQESVVRAIERMLREHDVVGLLDPREALQRITTGERFTVIVCDLMMPLMTGAALHERIRLVDADQAGRMVFVTGGATTTATREFVQRVGQPVLPKPFVVGELRAIVAAVARRGR